MEYNLTEGAVFAVRSAFDDLRWLISEAASGIGEEQVGELQGDLERFVFALTAAVIRADGRMGPDEERFLSEMFGADRMPHGTVRHVLEAAGKWSAMVAATPAFFSWFVENDPKNARRVLGLIQIIGNNVSIVDGNFAEGEHRLVQDCIARLEAALG